MGEGGTATAVGPRRERAARCVEVEGSGDAPRASILLVLPLDFCVPNICVPITIHVFH